VAWVCVEGASVVGRGSGNAVGECVRDALECCGTGWCTAVGGALTMGCGATRGMAEPGETLGSFGPVGGALFGTVVGGGEWDAAM
jgi:hypothetical protein